MASALHLASYLTVFDIRHANNCFVADKHDTILGQANYCQFLEKGSLSSTHRDPGMGFWGRHVRIDN